MFKVFDSAKTCQIILRAKLKSVKKATQDLGGNLERLSGQKGAFPITEKAESGTNKIFVLTVGDELPKNIIAPTDPESYTIAVTENAVYIVGFDELGTVYGIYGFATKLLNISPVYRLTDVFPKQTEALTLKEQFLASSPCRVRFRGWFLNDEDLLTDFKISGGTRNINYPFYQNVMDTDVLDMILETALRLENNLIIPGSFVDIDNPAEEKLVKTACERGLYVSQHHVEPMGVSYFGAENYLKKRGLDNEAISFITNRERMVEIWRYYAEKWAKYGDKVIWQLGLRGKADQAVWQADPSVPQSMKDRGGIISDAISAQYEIVRNTLKTDDFYSTATLWNEGSVLYGKGYLQLPKNTIPVFSDCGIDQMFGADLYDVALQSDRPFGVYYHIAFWMRGPHLTEGCHPEKQAFCYREASKTNKLCYSILNVSNVRPLHVSAMLNAEILKDPQGFSWEAELLKLDLELFGDSGKQINDLRRQYYGCFFDLGEPLLKRTAEFWHFYYREYEELPFMRNAADDGMLALFGKMMLLNRLTDKLPSFTTDTKLALAKSAESFKNLYAKCEALEADLPKETLLYFRQFLKYQVLHMQKLTEWCVACMELKSQTASKEEKKLSGEIACNALKTILEERTVLEVNGWENWHRGEKKIDILGLLELTERSRNEA